MADLQAARADGGTKKISLKRATVDMAVAQVAETECVSVMVRLGDVVGFEFELLYGARERSAMLHD
jgi:hypothetical protein